MVRQKVVCKVGTEILVDGVAAITRVACPPSRLKLSLVIEKEAMILIHTKEGQSVDFSPGPRSRGGTLTRLCRAGDVITFKRGRKPRLELSPVIEDNQWVLQVYNPYLRKVEEIQPEVKSVRSQVGTTVTVKDLLTVTVNEILNARMKLGVKFHSQELVLRYWSSGISEDSACALERDLTAFEKDLNRNYFSGSCLQFFSGGHDEILVLEITTVRENGEWFLEVDNILGREIEAVGSEN